MRAVPTPPFLRRLVKGLPPASKMMPVEKRKFGCLMGMLPPLFAKSITDWCLENIPDFHLGSGGREFRSHVTLKFGFTDSSPDTIEAVKEFFQGRPPIQVRLGGFGLFTSGYGKWKNEDGDVLFIEVDSPDLHQLNAELSAAFPCKDTHPEYKPHVTVAYLDPSVAESYRGLKAPFLNCSMILDTLEWSGADGVTEQFSLSILPQLGSKALDERKDKRGHRYCIDTDTGKRTRCPPKEEDSDEDTTEQEDSDERRKRNRKRSPRDARTTSETSGSVASENRRSAREGTDRERDAGAESTADSASQGVPASLPVVNQRLNRFEKFFREKNQHEIADWMGMLRNHINAVGGEEALKALGGQPQKGNDKTPVQYWGVATEEERWHHMGDFITDYLARNGISTVIEHSDPHTPLISAYGRPDKFIAEHGDFKPRIGSFANKLEESKHLPGLETSEDIGEIMGRPVTHLTDDVIAEMDRRYGKGRWIIKAYGDEAAAGYGIFFPQRAAAIKHDAQNTIWTAGERLARYGFELHRNKNGKVVGLKHHDGKFYRFGSDEYNDTIHGDARYWGDRAAVAADSEHGAILPDGGKEFMAQPAFQAVGISDAERAAGKTWHEKNEGRVHLVVKNGKAEIIPHSTWLKGGNLPVVFEDDDTRAMAKAAQDTINALPEHARKGQVYAPDIMKTPDGYRVVELNPQGDAAGSGYLTDNHFTIDSYVSHLAGREPAHVQFIRKLLESRKASKKKTEKTMDTRSAKPSPPSLKSLPNYGVKGRWVTMGAQEGGDEPGKHGGTRVYLGGDGKIEKGPKGTTGKKPSELSEKKPKAKKERKPRLKPPTIKKPEPVPEYEDDDQVVLPDDVDDLDLGNLASEMGDVYDDDDPLVIGDGPPDSKIDTDEDSVELDSDDLDTSGWGSESEEQASPESAEEEPAPGIDSDGDDLDTSGWEDLPDERAFDENAPPEEHLKAMSASVDKWLKDSDSVDGSDGLSPEQKKKYAKYANEVFAKMPAPMLVAVRKSLRSMLFLPDKKALAVVYARSGGKSETVEGFCDTFSGTVCVDGSDEVGAESSSGMMKYGMHVIHGVYAHEICHTLDEDTKHSRSKEWQSAWNDEIVKGKYAPSGYSQTSPAEGFAEFGRCLVRDADLAKKWFPKCYDYWKKQGWLE